MAESLAHPLYGDGPWDRPDGKMKAPGPEDQALMAQAADARRKEADRFAGLSNGSKEKELRQWALEAATGLEARKRLWEIFQGGYKVRAAESLMAFKEIRGLGGIVGEADRLIIQKDGDLRALSDAELRAEARKRLDEIDRAAIIDVKNEEKANG